MTDEIDEKIKQLKYIDKIKYKKIDTPANIMRYLAYLMGIKNIVIYTIDFFQTKEPYCIVISMLWSLVIIQMYLNKKSMNLAQDSKYYYRALYELRIEKEYRDLLKKSKEAINEQQKQLKQILPGNNGRWKQ